MSAGQAFHGPRVNVESHVAQAGVPDERMFEKWVRAALQGQRSKRRQVNIQLFDLEQARAINKTFTGKDYATNVLSFPYEPLPGEKTGAARRYRDLPVGGREGSQGTGQAAARPLRASDGARRPASARLRSSNEADAKRMEDHERRILADFGIADPYEIRN